MSQDPPSTPELSPAAPGRSPERVAVDVALRLGLLGLFAYLALELVRPFGALLIWAVVVAAALHPLYVGLGARLGGRRRLAAALVTAGALLVVLGPIAMLVASLVETAEWLAAQARGGALRLPDLPPTIRDLPVAGKILAANWDLAATNLEGFLGRYGRTLIGAGEAAARPALRLADGAVTFLAAVFLSGFLHLPGPRLGAALRRVAARVVGADAARFVDIATATIRNVARGVIGVAAIQALLIGIGLILGGVPGAGVLSLAVLVLAIVQIGALPVVIPTLVWVWLEKDGATATLLTAYLLPASLIDVPLKPLLLGKALATPALVIVAGVIGGTVSYGLVGLFLGPILLAIAYELARFWLSDAAPAVRTDKRGGME